MKDPEETEPFFYNLRTAIAVATLAYLIFLTIFHTYKLLTLEESRQKEYHKKEMELARQRSSAGASISSPSSKSGHESAVDVAVDILACAGDKGEYVPSNRVPSSSLHIFPFFLCPSQRLREAQRQALRAHKMASTLELATTTAKKNRTTYESKRQKCPFSRKGTFYK